MRGKQSGLTLVELMISIALGLFVVLAATALLVSTKAGYITEDEEVRLQESGRHAIEVITRAARQTAYQNWDSEEAPIIATASMPPDILGMDGRRASGSAEGIDAPMTDTVNGSDLLSVRFFGAGTGTQGDGTILDCAGFGIPAASSGANAEGARGWAIFSVRRAASGEAELYCKYKGRNGNWADDAIASGVESFQVLYGVDTGSDGQPDVFLNATGVDRLGAPYWKKVAVLRVALLLSGSENARPELAAERFELFGPDYAAVAGSDDPGTTIEEEKATRRARNRITKLFTATIQLRNRPLPDPMASSAAYRSPAPTGPAAAGSL